jgi:antitoxin StbD
LLQALGVTGKAAERQAISQDLNGHALSFYFINPVKRPIIRSFKFSEIIMTYPMLTETVASISELKANPMKVVASGEGMPVAVLNRNQPAFYCVPALAYQAMMELIDDMALLKIVQERQNEESIAVSLDDL